VPHRIERVNHLIRREISDLLCRYVKDPRLGNFITVTDVEVSSDLRYAKVFVSFLGSEEEKQAALKTLQTASGYFHTELAQRLKMRHVPQITFHWDDSIERGSRILDIIDRIDHESDANDTCQA
jgi:ribosome-binding factor A